MFYFGYTNLLINVPSKKAKKRTHHHNQDLQSTAFQIQLKQDENYASHRAQV